MVYHSIGPLYLIFVPMLLLFTGCPPKLKTLVIVFALLWVWWLYSMQLTRYLLPTLALLAPAAGYALHRCLQVPSALRLAPTVVVSTWLVMVLAVSMLFSATELPQVLGTISRQQYLESALEPFPAIDYLNRHTPPGAKLISYGEPRLFYLERDYLWGDPVYHRMIIYDTMREPANLLAAYNRLGITHVLYIPALLNRLSADREPVGPLLAGALAEGYLKYLVAPSFGQPYHLLQVTAAGRQSGQGRLSE